MKLFIPRLDTKLVVSQPWTFKLYLETRNLSMFDFLNIRWERCDDSPSVVTLPTGTNLKVDRIYIRKGNSKFDSVTFLVMDQKVILQRGYQTGRKSAVRFWAKLDDVNTLDCEIF